MSKNFDPIFGKPSRAARSSVVVHTTVFNHSDILHMVDRLVVVPAVAGALLVPSLVAYQFIPHGTLYENIDGIGPFVGYLLYHAAQAQPDAQDSLTTSIDMTPLNGLVPSFYTRIAKSFNGGNADADTSRWAGSSIDFQLDNGIAQENLTGGNVLDTFAVSVWYSVLPALS